MAFELCAASLQDWADSKYIGAIPTELIGIHQLARGLAFIHEKHYVHRDINPSNVLISVGGDRLIISGFGTCKRVRDSVSVGVSHYGQQKWPAPEHLKVMSDPHYRVTISSDTWSMGCVFYYFLTKGSHPFHDNDRRRMINKVTEGQFSLESKSSIVTLFTLKSVSYIEDTFFRDA